MADGEKKPFFTKRVLLSLLVLALGTSGLYAGKLAGGDYVLLCAIVIAGHHAVDLVKAWKGRDS